ncbi:MAG: hypothetical protein WBN35_00170, partial [Acidimicrobiia bacterium]
SCLFWSRCSIPRLARANAGIGWGSELSGVDGAGIVLIFLGIPALVVLLVGHLVIGLVQWLRGRSSVAQQS